MKYKTNDLPNVPEGIFTLPALTAGIQNQGLNNFVPREEATILKNVISISANGANTGATFYQNKEFTVLQDAYAIEWIYSDKKPSDRSYLYLTGCISKTIYGNYEWTNKAGWEKVKKENIYLPIKDREIDFEFMESFIAELEAERIAELEAYLSATGLTDYQLTAEEEKALELFETVEWDEFKIGDLFERVKSKKLNYKAEDLPKIESGKYVLPCLTSSFRNQGLNYFVPKKEATILKNVISIPSNSDVYRAYFQSREFTILSDAYAIDWINREENKLCSMHYLFIVLCINKVTDLPIYSYKNKLGGWNVVQNKQIQLPVKDEKIDYTYMATLISAMQKLVIKDVVEHTHSKLKT